MEKWGSGGVIESPHHSEVVVGDRGRSSRVVGRGGWSGCEEEGYEIEKECKVLEWRVYF